MDDNELLQKLQAEEADALGFYSDHLAQQQAEASTYYLANPRGDEQVGRSQVISADLEETIEWMMPSLMRTFTASGRVAQFVPRTAEDVEVAEQATDYVNYVFNNDNPGFMVLHTWFKDALMNKNGVIKVVWEEDSSTRVERFVGLDEDQLALIMSDDDYVEVIEHEENEDGTYNIKVKRTEDEGRCVVYNIPSEEFLISRNSRSIDDAEFKAHRNKKSRGELIALGYNKADIDQVGTQDDSAEYSEQRIIREQADDLFAGITGDTDDDDIWLTEAYYTFADNEDDEETMHRIVYAGDVIFENDEVDGHPFADITPFPMPHKWVGRSIHDQTKMIQDVKTVMLRQALDNLYLSNNPEKEVEDGNANIDDLMETTPGGIKRVKRIGAIREMSVPFVAGPAFDMIGYMDGVKRSRTGVGQEMTGMDADTLKQTNTGTMNRAYDAAHEKLELIARVFAETGVKRLFKLILKNVVQNQDAERMIRLRDEFVPIDPREWDESMDMSVAVGLGTGNRDQKTAQLAGILSEQKELLPLGMATPENIYNTLEKIVENSDLKAVGRYFQKPEQQPQQPPKPDPQLMAIQMQQQIEEQKLQLEAQKMQLQHERELMKMQAEDKRKFTEMELKYAHDVPGSLV